MIAGVDMYHKKFLAVMEDGRGETQIEIFTSFADLLARDELNLIVIDVPIGLPARGARSCDVLARQMVRQRRSSVFPAPIRPMLPAMTYEQAALARRCVEGKGCSRQAFGILPVIRGVDALITEALQQRVREGHPEVSFTAMAGRPMQYHKLRPEGRQERLQVLEQHFSDLLQQLDGLKRRGAVTDAIDAYAMLFTARRTQNGNAVTLPDHPEMDSRGLRMEIVY